MQCCPPKGLIIRGKPLGFLADEAAVLFLGVACELVEYPTPTACHTSQWSVSRLRQVAQPPDRDPQVKILADWLVNQRFGPSMTPQHRQLLDEQIPGWDETFRDAWERKAEEAAGFRLRPASFPRRPQGNRSCALRPGG